MTKVLLISPQENYPKKAETYPAGALLVLGSILDKEGIDVKCIHMVSDNIGLGELENEIRAYLPTIVGVTMNTFQTKYSKQIFKLVKTIDSNIVTVAGGPHPSALKLEMFKDFEGLDIVVYGEGENSFLDIVK